MATEKTSLLDSNANFDKSWLNKKLILVTGGNSGIGLEVCKVLCSKGHKVVATVRSEDKGQHCVSEVRNICPAADIHYMICELTDPKSVKQFAYNFKTKWLGEYLDVLINNAGVSPGNSRESAGDATNDWELSMTVNCIAPILLTQLLMDCLKETAKHKGEARVVMVNSGIILQNHMFLPFKVDFEDPMLQKPNAYVHGGHAYKNSKAALMMCTLALIDETKDSGVRINSLCPGEVLSTGISRNLEPCERCCFKCIFGYCFRCCFKPQTIDQGGNHVIELAIGEKGESNGLFFVKGDMKEAPPQCLDKQNQKDMLRITRNLLIFNR